MRLWFLRCLSRVAVICLSWSSIAGCSADTDVALRYELEKAVWEAKSLRKRAVSDPLNEDRQSLRRAMALYEEIVDADRFRRHPGGHPSSDVARDIERLLLESKIALSELYFVEYEDLAGVTYPATIANRHDLLLTTQFKFVLNEARSIYGPLESDSLEVRCAEAIRSVADDSSLSLAVDIIGDTLLAIPIHLTRVQRFRGDARPYDYAWAAEQFYARVIEIKPDAPVADRARVRRVDLFVLERRFEEALSELDFLLELDSPAIDRGDLLLWKGEILAHAVDREDQGERVLKSVVDGFPRTEAAAGAALNLAEIARRRGDRETAAHALRDIELDPATPRETAAAAIFLRALQADHDGDWVQAVHLLSRLFRLEPFTRAAVVSPWLIVRHAVESGNPVEIEIALDDASEFYLEAIDKHVAYLDYPHVLKDFLIESYLIADEPEAVAQLLETHAMNWRVDSGCVGLYKSALIYLNLLDDRASAVRMLQKCLDAFPSSHYAWIVRARLDRISPISH